MNEFLLLTATGLLVGIGSTGAAWYGRKLHHDFAEFLATVEANRERSEMNREVLARLVRDRDDNLTVTNERLAERLQSHE
jgi:hypothetical protein